MPLPALAIAAPAIASGLGSIFSAIGGGKKAKEEKRRNQAAEKAAAQTNAAYGDFSDRFKGYGEEAYGYGTGIRDYATDKYKSLYDEMESGSGGGGGGGIPGYGGEFDQYKDFWDRIGRTGAPDEDMLNTMRGYGNFKEFARTGGLSDTDRANFRARATSGTPGLFAGLKRAVSGSRGGYTANLSQLARDRASAMRDATLGAETNLADQIRQGRQWGSTEGSGAEFKILENMKEGNTQGLSIADRIAAMNRAAAASRSAGASDNFNQRMSILGQLRGLRGETGAEMDYGNMELAGIGGRAATNANLYNSQNNAAANAGPNIWERLGGGIGAVGGALGGMGGGNRLPKIPVQNKYTSNFSQLSR